VNAEQRIHDLGLVLPSSSAPAANYANTVRTGNLLYLAGKGPLPVDGAIPKGRLGREFTTAEGYQVARSVALDLIAGIRAELGTLDRVARVVEIQGFLNAVPEFQDHAKVLDGCSDLLVEVFAERGVHARSVFGASSLRDGVPVIVRGVVEVES
jgi:enamine deaminase RidA (YjgF/YER057c/UK114 family)